MTDKDIEKNLKATFRSFKILVKNLTLFLPGEGGISPLIVYHVTKSVRKRVKNARYLLPSFIIFK